MPASDCATPEELRAYHLGKLAPAMQERIASHLETCAACETLAEWLEGAVDPVVAALRWQPPGAAVLPSTWKKLSAGGAATQTPETSPLALPRPAQRIGDYEVLEELGRGGMGVVYKAHQRRLNRVVALKMVLTGIHAGPGELARFLVEAEMVARLTHPSIVQIHEVGEFDGMPFLALEYVAGGTLAAKIQGRPQIARWSADLIAQLARAMQHAHERGVVHRDLKPANILLAFDEGRSTKNDKGTSFDSDSSFIPHPSSFLPKVTDFGLAREIRSPTGLTRTGSLLGTPAYMAPEQASGGHFVGPASDIYALGVILYELLAGRPPFVADDPLDVLQLVQSQEASSPSRYCPGLPRDLCTICLRCLEKEPSRRYLSAVALAEDLSRFLAGEPIQARSVNGLERTWKWARRRPAIALLLLALAVTLPAATVVSTFFAFVAHGRAKIAEEAREASQKAKRDSDLHAAELTFHTALADAEAGTVERAMFRMLEALRLAPADALAFRRVVRINIATLAQRLPILVKVLPDRRRGWFLGPEGKTFAAATTSNFLERRDSVTGEILDEQGGSGAKFPEEPFRLTRDGRFVLTREATSNRLRLRDAADGQSLGAPLDWGRPAFSADSQILAVNREIDRYNAARREAQFVRSKTGQPIGPRIQEDDFRLLTARDGRLALMIFPNRRLKPIDPKAPARFCDLESGKPLARFEPASDIGDPTVAFDGTSVVTLDEHDGTVRWWGPNDGVVRRDAWRPPRLKGQYSAFSALTADARTLIALGADDRMRWYDLATGRNFNIALPNVSDPADGGLAVAPDGNAVLSSSKTQVLRLWRMPPLPQLPAQSAGDPPPVVFRQVAFSPDRQNVFVGGTTVPRPIAHLLRTGTGQPVGRSNGDVDRNPAFSGDSKRLATCVPALLGLQQRVIVREVATGSILLSMPISGFVHGLALDATGEHLAFGQFGGTYLVEVESGQFARLPQSAAVTQLLFSPDGKYVATGSQAGWGQHQSCFRVWNTISKEPLGPEIATSDAARFYFGPDSQTLLALELRNCRLRRWKVGAEVALDDGVFLDHKDGARLAAFRPDGGQVLASFVSGTVQMFDTTTGKTVGAPMSHPAPVAALAYSADGSMAAVGCEDGAVQIWDTAVVMPLGPPLIHRYPILGLAFAPDSRSLLAATSDGRHYSWPLAEPVPDDPTLLEDWLATASGCNMEGEAVHLLEPSAWYECQRRLGEVWPEAAAELRRGAPVSAWRQALIRQRENQGDFQGALWHLDRLLANMEQGEPARLWHLQAGRADLLAALGQRDAAGEEYRRLQSSGSSDDVLSRYRFQADSLQATEQWDLTLWYVNRALALQPGEWELYEQRAELHQQLGHLQERRADLARAVELGGKGAVVVELATARAAQGRWQEARTLLENAREPNALALVLLWQRDTKAYRDLCAELIRKAGPRDDRVDSKDAQMRSRIFTLGPQSVSDFQTALALAEAALRVLPPAVFEERRQCSITLAGLLIRSGQPGKALDLLQRALEAPEDKDFTRVWLFLALAQHELGEDVKARAWLMKAQQARAAKASPFDWASLEAALLCREIEELLGKLSRA